ncbi:hypothetical protein ACFSTC_42925 [Nonomuraea ferruginea]
MTAPAGRDRLARLVRVVGQAGERHPGVRGEPVRHPAQHLAARHVQVAVDAVGAGLRERVGPAGVMPVDGRRVAEEVRGQLALG